MKDPDPSSATQPPLGTLLSLSEAAARCRLSPSHLRRLVRDGKVWGVKLGRNWLTTEVAVREYLAQHVRPGPKPHANP